MKDSVVITGTGLVCALGHSPEEVWAQLLAGACGVRPMEGWTAEDCGCRFAAQVAGLARVELGVAPRLAKMLEPHTSLLLQSSRDALDQCGLQRTALAAEEIGFFAGMGMVDYAVEDLLAAVLKSLDAESRLDYGQFFSRGYREIYPLWPLAMLNNIAFCQVAISLDLRGENGVFSPHADSGMQAIVEGAAVLREGRAQAVAAGGVSEAVSPSSLARARLNGLMPAADQDAAAAGGPFAADRNGTVLGEGCAMVILERRAAAQGRGAHCLARISGWGHACEIAAPASWGARAGAIARAMQSALEQARARPEDIDVLIAHGDGTRDGDSNETEAIHQTFAGSLDQLKVFSSKGALGHLLAAAPAVDVILGTLMIAQQKIPATINAEPADSAVRFHLVTGRPSPAKVRKVMINARSHEGPCASLIIEAVD